MKAKTLGGVMTEIEKSDPLLGEMESTDLNDSPRDTRKDYTAIVYFHGIGRQRRFEEIGRLVDSLDQFSGYYGQHYPNAKDTDDLGALRSQKLVTEPAGHGDDTDPDSFYSYISFKRFVSPTQTTGRKRSVPVDSYRLYEGYWSNVVAEGLGTLSVLVWVFARVWTPLGNLFLRPWRSHKRLKLSYLFRLQRDAGKKGDFVKSMAKDPDGLCVGADKSIYEQLADAYHVFESWPARRAFPKGSFGEFKKFLQHGVPSEVYFNTGDKTQRSNKNSWLGSGWIAKRKPEDAKRMLVIAKKWRGRFIRGELKVLLLLLNVIVFVAGMVMLASYVISPLAIENEVSHGASDGQSSSIGETMLALAGQLAKSFFDLPIIGALPAWYATLGEGWLPMPWVSVLAIIVILGAINVGRTVLREFVSDIVFWTAREGKSPLFDQREKILERAIKILDHVTSDENCKRVVVIGHSLGTPIGYEALLELGKRRCALQDGSDENPQRYNHSKISHFVSLGSPIEIITYFFDLISSKSHRYNRLAVDIEGSARQVPFRQGRKKQISWINIGSRADPVSHDIATQSGLRSAWVDDIYKDKAPSSTPRRHSKAIEEIQVVSMRRPNPGAAHSGYFFAPEAMERLYRAAILNDAGPNAAKTHNLNPVTPEIRHAADQAAAARDFGFAVLGCGAFLSALAAAMQLKALFQVANAILVLVLAVLFLRYVYLWCRDIVAPLNLAELIRKKALEKRDLDQ